ncbi:hypothetical protein QUB80_02655 [Chlorogloeopsis sp. ULAP01]|uniref:hypothetical protein n=1 Tax=Chlorogloeopsis sp. ULAP01 TaxID=3056483 RepID=UPI0025AA44DF|nr:hypothetical protein [Chlorogloeopsis sp. ULAP01]MDM9379602.1 hypothetical protein [Chlorogloeopsis sp. ULAP01]
MISLTNPWNPQIEARRSPFHHSSGLIPNSHSFAARHSARSCNRCLQEKFSK